jgi:hypothetical protein
MSEAMGMCGHLRARGGDSCKRADKEGGGASKRVWGERPSAAFVEHWPYARFEG